MTTSPDFDDLSPPDELYKRGTSLKTTATEDIIDAYRAGARHGWEQAKALDEEREARRGEARQLWPEPITDRPPTAEDADEWGNVQYLFGGKWWHCSHWATVEAGRFPWRHCLGWQLSLQEQAMKALHRACTASDEDRALIRRALEQAGEGQA